MLPVHNKLNMSAKSRQEIADEDHICVKTLNKWLNAHDIKIGRGLITPKQMEEIYKKLGIPK